MASYVLNRGYCSYHGEDDRPHHKTGMGLCQPNERFQETDGGLSSTGVVCSNMAIIAGEDLLGFYGEFRLVGSLYV